MTKRSHQPRNYSIPLIDLAGEKQRQVIVDREPGQYLGHPTTVLLEDGKTIIAVYPKGHGRGAIQLKRSTDGGLTWSERLPTPKNWETSLETPTIHRVIDARGRKRLIVFSGLYPIRMSVSENDGKTWSELKPIGDGVNPFGGIVARGFVEALKTGQGSSATSAKTPPAAASTSRWKTSPPTASAKPTSSTATAATAFVRLMRQQIDRAESYYARSAPLESHIASDSRPTLVAMTQIYHRLLRKLAEEPQRVLRERVSLSIFTKLMIGWRASWAK